MNTLDENKARFEFNRCGTVCIAKIRRPEDSHVKLDGSQPPWCEGLTTFFTFKHCFMHVKQKDYFMESERVWDFHTSW